MKNKLYFLCVFLILIISSCETNPHITQRKNLFLEEELENQKDEDWKELLRIASKMSLEEKRGLLSMVSIPDQVLSKETIQFLKKYHVSGVILFRRNIVNEKQLKRLTEDIRSYVNPDMLISIDQEGGQVVRIDWDKNKTISASKIGKNGRKEYAYRIAYDRALLLLDLGIDVILGPVCDVSSSRKSFIYDRTFGKSEKLVADMVEATVKAQKDAGIITVLKHFPGLGSTEIDSHVAFPFINRTLGRLYSREFVPFMKGIEAGAEMVLIGHVNNKYIDPDLPASVSRKYQEILYRDLKFQGILITDDLSMTGEIRESIGWGINLICGNFNKITEVIERIKPDVTQCAKILKLLKERKKKMENKNEN